MKIELSRARRARLRSAGTSAVAEREAG
jgi:hypothetical protein